MKYLVVLMSAALLAQAQAGDSKRGRQIVDEALAALGGEKFLTMRDRIEDGRFYSFYREQLSGLAKGRIYTRYLETPGNSGVAQRERQSFGKDEDYAVLLQEDRGYLITYRGAKPLPEERWRRYVDSTRRNILYILRHRLQEPGMIFEYRGTQVWQNNPVEVVDITDAENNVLTVYFQRTTKLPLRQVYVRRDPKTKERDEMSTVYSKYRDIGGGVQWPYNMVTERNGEKVFELFSENVTINQGLSDELFTLPVKLKILSGDRT